MNTAVLAVTDKNVCLCPQYVLQIWKQQAEDK